MAVSNEDLYKVVILLCNQWNNEMNYADTLVEMDRLGYTKKSIDPNGVIVYQDDTGGNQSVCMITFNNAGEEGYANNYTTH
jgi:hypothetical protein